MDEIGVVVSGIEVDFDLACELGRSLARQGNPETSLIAWSDREANRHSPSCVKCEIGAEPGWLVYGRNHGGRLKVAVNDGAYVLIFS